MNFHLSYVGSGKLIVAKNYKDATVSKSLSRKVGAAVGVRRDRGPSVGDHIVPTIYWGLLLVNADEMSK